MRQLSPKNRPQQAGFTLIEVMIALMIAAVAVIAIIDAMGKTSWVASELEQRVLASWVASNAIAEIRYEAKINKIKQGSRSSTVEMGGQDWRVKTRIKETDVTDVFKLTVEVRDRQRGKDAAYVEMVTAVTSAQ